MYDSALQMYTLCESLAAMGQDVGRMKAFSPGWLENQSVWLHMSYKYYLELLRGGLYEEFFSEVCKDVSLTVCCTNYINLNNINGSILSDAHWSCPIYG
jgi:hypothetical protein